MKLTVWSVQLNVCHTRSEWSETRSSPNFFLEY